MIEFALYNFACIWSSLDETTVQAGEKVERHGRDAKISGDELTKTRHAVKQLQDLCIHLHLTSSYDQCANLELKLALSSCFCTDIQSGLEGIKRTLKNEFLFRSFAYIPPSNQKFFENKKLFGGRVHKGFRSARPDIKEAGNCLAADLHTAAVFHLMRVAERGMRALAKHLGVRITKQRREQKCPKCSAVITEAGNPITTPIEYAMWEDVLKALKKKIGLLENSAKGTRRTKEFNFYHGLLDDLQKFKNVDRNELMHTRRSYTDGEATVVFDSVKGFMVKLSSRISEANK